MEIGEFVKVVLPVEDDQLDSENPWAEVVHITSSGFVGRLDNELICTDLHGYAYDDRVSFAEKGGRWVAQHLAIH